MKKKGYNLATREGSNLFDESSSRARKSIPILGICRTRTIAERRAAEKLEKLGINSTQAFIEATCSVTFKA